MMSEGVIYGGSVSYRNMCRFNSGVRVRFLDFFFFASGRGWDGN